MPRRAAETAPTEVEADGADDEERDEEAERSVREAMRQAAKAVKIARGKNKKYYEAASGDSDHEL